MLNMKIDNPQAFRFIMQDEIYLLDNDKIVSALPAAEGPIVKTPDIAFNYLGKNNKNFLILVNYAGDDTIPAAHLTALENILKRMNLSIDDVAILNTHAYTPLSLEMLGAHFKYSKLLVMGNNALPVDIGALTLNQPKKESGYAVLYSFSFDEMMESNEHKKAFWEQMKTL
jgi:DNA polymerase III psi subunit